MTNNFIERVFQVLAVILIGVAVFFLWQKNYDGVFVSAVVGCVSFFLSIRFQVKERLEQREAKRLEKEEFENKLLEEKEENELEIGKIVSERETSKNKRD